MREKECNFSAPTQYSDAHRSTAVLAQGAWLVTREMNAAAVVCWSQGGGTARYLSKNSFHVPIVAYTSDEPTARRMSLYRCVLPVCAKPPGRGTLSDWNVALDDYVRSRNIAKRGDMVVLVAGRPLGHARSSNTLALYKVGEPTTGYIGH
jgi:pyruvate kinase